MPSAADAAADASFRGFNDGLRRDAKARGISDATFEAAFRGVVSPDSSVLAGTKARGSSRGIPYDDAGRAPGVGGRRLSMLLRAPPSSPGAGRAIMPSPIGRAGPMPSGGLFTRAG